MVLTLFVRNSALEEAKCQDITTNAIRITKRFRGSRYQSKVTDNYRFSYLILAFICGLFLGAACASEIELSVMKHYFTLHIPENCIRWSPICIFHHPSVNCESACRRQVLLSLTQSVNRRKLSLYKLNFTIVSLSRSGDWQVTADRSYFLTNVVRICWSSPALVETACAECLARDIGRIWRYHGRLLWMLSGLCKMERPKAKCFLFDDGIFIRLQAPFPVSSCDENEAFLCWNRFLEPLWPKSYRSWYFIPWLV